MARKKSVSISAKPAGVREPERATEPASGTVPLDELFHAPLSGQAPAAEPEHDDEFGWFGRGVYRGIYAVSYGVVLGVIFIGKAVPGRRCIARGMHDGTTAARRTAASFEQRAAKARDAVAEARTLHA
ncbi:MAG: hypothetical protein U1E83_07485 [Methylotetracoccus sp.]